MDNQLQLPILGSQPKFDAYNMKKGTRPQFTRGDVNRAGEIFRDVSNASNDSVIWAANVLGKWRAMHNYPINTFQATLRHKQQHAWATAVETMGTFLNFALKSSEGPDEWLKFFALTGSAFAHLENRNAVPGYERLTAREAFLATAEKAQQLKVREKLSGFGEAINAIHSDKKKGTYYLLILDPLARTLRFQAYSKERFDIATADYLKAEELIVKGSQQQAVLVATASVEALRRAYPNFFLDTHEFLKILMTIEQRAAKSL